MKRHRFNFELISFVKWKPIPVNDPRATILSSFVFATLVYGVIGYKFCWLLPHSRSTSWTWISWYTNLARIINELINSWRKSFDKRGLRVGDGNATLSNAKIVFAKPCEEKFPKKLLSHIKFHCTHCGKVGHTFDRCYATLFDNFQRKLTNLMNECHALKDRLLNVNKRVSMKSSNIPYNGILIVDVHSIWLEINLFSDHWFWWSKYYIWGW